MTVKKTGASATSLKHSATKRSAAVGTKMKQVSVLTVDRTSKKRPKSAAFEAIHSLAAGLASVGAIDELTMRKFDAACLEPVVELTPKVIVQIRKSTAMSQPVFAAHIGTSKSTVQKWESGDKKPSGAAAKLLSIVKKHGVQVLL